MKRKVAGITLPVAIFGEVSPRGIVLLWDGSPKNIPAGWAICDGSDGGRDLRQSGGQLGLTFIKKKG